MSDELNRYVLDSWAVLALLQQEEPAASRVKQLIQQANEGLAYLALSIINLGEIYYIIGRSRGSDAAESTVQKIQQTAIDLQQVEHDDVIKAASFKMQYPISYADAFAVATTVQLDAILLTGDPELTSLTRIIKIEPLIRSGT